MLKSALKSANSSAESNADHEQIGMWVWTFSDGEGGGYKMGGGAREVLPLQKGGAEKVLDMLIGGGGGHQKCWGSFYAVA